MSIQLVVIAGGKGTRLGNVSKTLPKSLIPVANKPFLDHQLSLIRRWGVDRILFCLGHLGNEIRDFLSRYESNLEFNISFEGETPKGTGGALLNAWEKLEEQFAVVYGDSYLLLDFEEAFEDFKSSKESLMCVARSPYFDCPNNVNVESGFISQYSKATIKSEFRYLDYGLIFFKKFELEKFKSRVSFDLSEILELLIKNRSLRARVLEDEFYEVGTERGIKRLEEFLSKV